MAVDAEPPLHNPERWLVALQDVERENRGPDLVRVPTMSPSLGDLAFRWSDDSGMQLLPPLPGYSRSVATAINDAGVVVGLSRGSGLSDRATLWLVDGTAIDLNTLIDPGSGYQLWSAWGINNRGEIVGAGMNGVGERNGFLLVPAPGWTTFLLACGGLAASRRRR
jgi:probable HAF family extracellular repeat protein